MSHQWFFWKTMLDLGESEFAYKIAIKALDVWKKEVETSYNCMEHFLVENSRGAGWHEFGGLSAPVLNWYSAYFRPGNLTTGFDTWIENKIFDDNFTNLSVDLFMDGNSNNVTSTIVCMNPEYQYDIKWNGEKIPYKTAAQGTLSIDIPINKIKKGKLEVIKN